MFRSATVLLAGVLIGLLPLACTPEPVAPTAPDERDEPDDPDAPDAPCPAGTAGTPGACVDVNECATDNGGCAPERECLNTEGSFSCGACRSGLQPFGSFGCEDIDECATGNGGCDPNRECVNEEPGFSCGACRPGFVAFGATACDDVDECRDGTDTCADTLVCTNTVGSFTCDPCPEGFESDGSGGCRDVDECATATDLCSDQRACQNEVGTYGCGPCPGGFREAGEFACADVDECLTDNGGCVNRGCSNAPGTRTCATCFDGFLETSATVCADVNECSQPDVCDPATRCENLPGTFTCSACPGGFIVDGLPLTGEDICPEFVLVELLGYTVGPGVGDGTTWDGTSQVPQSTFDAIRSAIASFNPIAGFVAGVAGPLIASSVDAPDSFGTFAINGEDFDVNTTRSYSIFTQDNDFFPSISTGDFTPKTNFCGLSTGPSFGLKIGEGSSLRLALIDEDNLFDDDIGIVNLSEAQVIGATNAARAENVGSAFVDVTQGRERAPILDVNIAVRVATFGELINDDFDCRNTCQFAADGICDEPEFCAPGTDSFDCGR